MPIWPSTPGNVTISTSSEYAVPSGVTTSSFKVLAIINYVSPLCCSRQLRLSALGLFGLGTLLLRIIGRLNLLNSALHVEIAFRHIIMLAIKDFLEATNGVGHLNLLSFCSRENLCHAKGLTEEPLNFARAIDREFVLRRKFVHTRDRNDVLQVFVALEDAL